MEFLTKAENIKMINNIAMIIILLLCIVSMCKWLYDCKFSQNTIKRERNINSKIYFIVFAAAFVVGVGTRIYTFGQAPGGLFFDEAMAAIDGKAIADYGTDHYGMRFPVYFEAWKNGHHSIMMGYIMAPIIKLFGFSKLTIRLPLLLTSIAGAVFLVLLAKDMFGMKAAAITALIVAMNPWHFMQSRWALDCYMFPHFFIISLYFLNKGMKNKKWLYVSMVFFGLTMYCYGISIYIVPTFLVAFAIYALIKKYINIKELLISIAVYLFIAWPNILCIMVNFFKWDTISTPLFTIPRFYETQRQTDLLFFTAEPLKQLWANAKELFNLVVLQKSDFSTHSIQGFSTMYYFSIPLAVVGLIYLFIQKNKLARGVILVSLISCAAGCLVTLPGTWRIAILLYPLMILTALGIKFIIDKIRFSEWAVLASYAMIFIMFVSVYFTTWATDMYRNFFGDFCAALEYVETFDVDKYYITSTTRLQDTKKESEAYTIFFHDIDARYYQGLTNENHGKTYLPYKERYKYSNIQPSDVKENENAAYIITTAEKKYFDETKYDFKPFRGYQTDYYAVTKKQ